MTSSGLSSRVLARPRARAHLPAMACSRYEYVKKYETHDTLLRNAWAVIRLDGRGFTRFTAAHGYAKPNDARGLAAMCDAARAVLAAFPDIAIAYGQSDEFSFVLSRKASLFGRRREKILSTLVSLFSAEFIRAWVARFGGDGSGGGSGSESGNGSAGGSGGGGGATALLTTPTFDGRIVVYPGVREVRDYLSWRQADCHVNNLFNTCFWLLVQDGVARQEAERMLQGTVSSDKNELLFSRFGVNYNKEPAMFRKGSVLFRLPKPHAARDARAADPAGATGAADAGDFASAGTTALATATATELPAYPHRHDAGVVTCHEDIIRDAFWKAHPHLLDPP